MQRRTTRPNQATGATGSRTRSAPAAPAAEPAPRELRTRLAAAIPEPRCELDHRSPWELVVATILSAQSTDRMVNTVTPALFERWPTPRALADASQEEVEKAVHRTGFFRSKAKSLRAAAALVAGEFGGAVPRRMEDLVRLPGVARKTANVVLGTAYGIAEGVVVDTHATRVAQRLQLTTASDPAKIEQDLCRRFPRKEWIDLGHRLVLHGRYVCLARAPRCDLCPLNEVCPSRERNPEGTWRERAAREQRVVETRGLDPGDGAGSAQAVRAGAGAGSVSRRVRRRAPVPP